MRNELLRGLPPENKLSALERKSRVLKFKAFAKDLLSVRKTEGHKARSAAECIVPYINDRLELLEMETQYAVLWRRIKLLRARTIGKSNSSHVSRILMEVVRRGCDITKRDQKNALRSTKKKITALIEKIAADAVLIDNLLTDIGIEIDETLRPDSCLPNCKVRKDFGSKPAQYSVDGSSVTPNARPTEVGTQKHLEINDAEDASQIDNSSVSQKADYQRAILVYQTLCGFDSICRKTSQKSPQLDQWVMKYPKSPITKLFKRNPDEATRICQEINGCNNDKLAIHLVSLLVNKDPATIRRYWNKYRIKFGY